MATITPRGNTYVLNWSEMVNGKSKQFRKSLGRISKKEAEVELAAKVIELAGGAPLSGLAPIFAVYIKVYVNWHKHEFPDSHARTEQIINQHLMPIFGDRILTSITSDDADQYKWQRAKKVADSTVNKELRVLQAVFNRAVETGVIQRNPIKASKSIREHDSAPPVFYSSEELEGLYVVDPIHWATWKFMANTGLRRSEMLNLEKRYVLPGRVRVVSKRDARTKSGKWRDVPLSPGAQEAVDYLLKTTEGKFVVPRVAKQSLSRAFSKAAKRAGLEGSLHSLRHTFCSQLVMQGVSLRTVQVLAGHASFSTTEKYAHLAPDYLENSVSGLNL